MNLSSSLEFLRLLEEQKLRIDLCDTGKNIKIKELKMAKKEGGSLSVQFFSTIASAVLGKTTIPISVKLYPDNSNIDILGLKYEARVYKKVIDTILAKNESPNFVSFIASGCCSKIPSYVKDLKKIENFMKANEQDTTKGYCMTVTERVGNGAQFGFGDDLKVYSAHEFQKLAIPGSMSAVSFQVFYSLYVMQKYRIVHNDLHAGNVLIMVLPEDIELGFIVGKDQYLLKTRYIPYIFDWDLAYCDSLGDNPKIDSKYERYGVFNNFSEKRDLYTYICTLGYYKHWIKSKPVILKEEGHEIEATEKQLKYIKQFKPVFYDHRGYPVYDFTYSQLKEIIPSMNKFTTGKLVLSPIGMISFYSGFGCRMTVHTEQIPTPLEMLKLFGKKYITDTDVKKLTQFVYTAPTSGEAARILLGKTGKGREELKLLGLRPTFKEARSGYVKTGKGLGLRESASLSSKRQGIGVSTLHQGVGKNREPVQKRKIEFNGVFVVSAVEAPLKKETVEYLSVSWTKAKLFFTNYKTKDTISKILYAIPFDTEIQSEKENIIKRYHLTSDDIFDNNMNYVNPVDNIGDVSVVYTTTDGNDKIIYVSLDFEKAENYLKRRCIAAARLSEAQRPYGRQASAPIVEDLENFGKKMKPPPVLEIKFLDMERNSLQY